MRTLAVKGTEGRHWGEVKKVDGRTVYVTVRKSNHFCWKHRGYGIQYDLFQEMKAAGIEEIQMRVGSRTLISSLRTWDMKGTIDILNQRDGEQIFLPDGMQDREA